MREAFFVKFANLRAFSVGTFITIGWKWDKKFIQPMSNVLTRKKAEIDRKKTTFDKLQLATIHFDGSIDPRNLRGKNNFKGKLYHAYAGNVIYSKIDVRNGAIGIIPPSMPEAAVSGEYPIYEVHLASADAGYIHLVFRTSIFQKILNSMISGTSGRKRVQPSQIENVEIPIPPIETQRIIVTHWQDAQKAATQAEKKVEKIKLNIISDIKKKLGRVSNLDSNRPKAFVLSWSDIERWGVEISRQPKSSSGKSSFLIYKFADLCKISSGGTPPRKLPQYFKGEIPWVKTTEVKDEIILETEEHISKAGLENSSAKVYPKGSLIIAMYGQGATRGRTAKLGIDAATNQACAVLTEFDSRINPDYLWVYLMSEYNELRSMASGNNQPNLNAAMIANYDVPVPSLKVQEEIVTKFMNGRAEIARQKELAEKIRRDAKAEVEELILGTKKI